MLDGRTWCYIRRMQLSSPPCYLGVLVSEADWSGVNGAPQVAALDGWTLRVEPQVGVGWLWSLRDESAPDVLAAGGVVRFDEVSDSEAEAKTRAADAWTAARDDADSSG